MSNIRVHRNRRFYERIPSEDPLITALNPSTGKPSGYSFFPDAIEEMNFEEYGLYNFLCHFGTSTVEELAYFNRSSKEEVRPLIEKLIKSGWAKEVDNE